MATAPTAGRTGTLNGIRIYFETHGSGEALLLLNGFSGSSQDWLSSAPGWGPDFQIILPDLRGHGRSSILPKPFGHQDAATDIIALLDYLRLGCQKGISSPNATVKSAIFEILGDNFVETIVFCVSPQMGSNQDN